MSNVLPVIASVGGTLVGLAGVAATYFSGKGQRATALAVAEAQSRHQTAMAHEERHQRRLEVAYGVLLAAVVKTEDDLAHLCIALRNGEAFENPEVLLRLEETMPYARPLPSAGDRALWSAAVAERERDFRRRADTLLTAADNAFAAHKATQNAPVQGISSSIGLTARATDRPRASENNRSAAQETLLAAFADLTQREAELDQAGLDIRAQVRLELVGPSLSVQDDDAKTRTNS